MKDAAIFGKLMLHRLIVVAALGTIAATTNYAIANTLEDVMGFPTDIYNLSMFPLNPSHHKLDGLRVGAAAAQSTEETTLDQSITSNDVIETKSEISHMGLGLLYDIGAGAALGVQHQVRFEKDVTTASFRPTNELEELTKHNLTTATIYIELTTNLNAALTIRHLFKKWNLIGNPRLTASENTIFGTSMAGYGSGLHYKAKKFGVSYSYIPPMRGKSSIQGEEMIIVEPGKISADFSIQPTKNIAAGITVQRWIHELDDRARGTTSEDLENTISLYGLDINQYVAPNQMIVIGGEFAINRDMKIHGSVGRKKSEYKFGDLQRYNRVSVSQSDTHREYLEGNIYKAMFSMDTFGMNLSAGMSLFSQTDDLPEFMNGATFKSNTRETFVSAEMKL